jgi:hypothetical protein
MEELEVREIEAVSCIKKLFGEEWIAGADAVLFLT